MFEFNLNDGRKLIVPLNLCVLLEFAKDDFLIVKVNGEVYEVKETLKDVKYSFMQNPQVLHK